MQSIGQRVRDLNTELSKPTDSDVVHLRTLRAAHSGAQLVLLRSDRRQLGAEANVLRFA